MFVISLVAFLISLLSMPIIIKFSTKFNIFDYQDARKIHSGNISRLGGVGIAISFFVCTAVYFLIADASLFIEYLPIISAGLIIFVFGFIDDVVTLRAIVKLLIQIVATCLVIFSGNRFTQIGPWQIPSALSYIFTFCWVIGVVNAFNLIDGLDGLCGSLAFTTTLTLGIIYTLSGNNISVICFILAASILGFLCFNWPPAKLFMGDCGSQFLGFMLATLPLIPADSVIEFNKFLIIASVAAFPIFDTIAAIWRRIRDKRPIMSPDKSHLHHKLLNMGYTKKNSLYLVVFIQLLLCSLVIISYLLGTYKGMMVLLLTLFFVTLFFTFIHYTNQAILKRKGMEESEQQ